MLICYPFILWALIERNLLKCLHQHARFFLFLLSLPIRVPTPCCTITRALEIVMGFIPSSFSFVLISASYSNSLLILLLCWAAILLLPQLLLPLNLFLGTNTHSHVVSCCSVVSAAPPSTHCHMETPLGLPMRCIHFSITLNIDYYYIMNVLYTLRIGNGTNQV